MNLKCTAYFLNSHFMFILKNKIDSQEIGNSYPQILHMSDDYINCIEKSVQTINFDDKIDYIPNLKSFKLEFKAKLTDSLSCVPANYGGLIISEKLLKIFLDSNTENYQYFEANVIYRKKDYKYFYFFIYGQNYDLVDFKNMQFWGESEPEYSHKIGSYDLSTITKKEIKITSVDQIIYWMKLYPTHPKMRYEVVKLNIENIKNDMVRLPFKIGGYYIVNEDLKNKILEAGCTGIGFVTKDWQEREII